MTTCAYLTPPPHLALISPHAYSSVFGLKYSCRLGQTKEAGRSITFSCFSWHPCSPCCAGKQRSRTRRRKQVSGEEEREGAAVNWEEDLNLLLTRKMAVVAGASWPACHCLLPIHSSGQNKCAAALAAIVLSLSFSLSLSPSLFLLTC